MEKLVSFFTNQWVVGIGTTVISAVFVSYGTKWFTRKKQDKRYILANKEVMEALRPMYLSLMMPSKITIDAVISSVAREFNFSSKELNSVENIKQDIFREIVSNNFLSVDLKKDFISEYESVVQADLESRFEIEEEMYSLRADRTTSAYKNNLLKIYVIIFGSALMAIYLLMLYSIIYDKKYILVSPGTSLFNKYYLLFLVLYSMVMLFFVYYRYKIKKNRKKDK